MSRRFTPKIVTANTLMGGEPIYLTATDHWSHDHQAAELLIDEDQAELRLIFAMGQPHLAVGPYLADARPGRRGPEPASPRERVRTIGPSNYAHGPQARRRPGAPDRPDRAPR
ncbi:sulfite reductase [Brevirhabdus pacifica]|uniref:Sulfite reductase n=1 Tax=Brevirhabdus pacifica TaxID=1267768 RepID=A0A1U7DKY0_9RHOB|nr:DUF2849 domain-containing protein [Brevirhabdus pacifica]APX90677.1 sulfite reductase [Brevirhabdus pacifica]PJJ85174.1 uncharacterized protein DUF2849 [Brevirhabdus pacifica]